MLLQKIIHIAAIFVFLNIQTGQSSNQGAVVQKWANEIGEELWKLGQTITKFSEIKQRYAFNNAQVETKDPETLLNEIVSYIVRMMDRKGDATRCIVARAESEAKKFEYDINSTDFQYYSSKYSQVGNETIKYKFKTIRKSLNRYKKLTLNNDTHFYNIPVNINHSSVHVPTNIFDLHKDAAIAIQWSEELDDVFRQNYNTDPSLSWQYFCSSSGVMRHYPAKGWGDYKKDVFDCRIRTWNIEASTCTKDIVILMDNSGSMDAMGKHIGSLTASSILDTLSNNDYVNVMNYSTITNFTIPCFANTLVQATEENIQVFKDALEALKPNDKSDLRQGLVEAFKLLEEYRVLRKCDGNGTNFCNQAIMVITDGIAANLTDTIKKYDFLNNGTYIPVRIFTYLVGREVVNAEEGRSISCATRGYYMHVQSLEQVTAAVLQYINVIARPLILYQKNPVSWTHASMDDTYQDKQDTQINEPYRLLTSAAAPAFDYRANCDNSTGKVANLLGVAGTDVPIDDIMKLTLPYKIGVNGYAFIVSNNGYILMHPDLRPMFDGVQTKNFNSIDISEVEQVVTEQELHPRVLSELIKDLRRNLIMDRNGNFPKVPIKYHYDHMRRVSVEEYDYYYARLESTPFTLALAIPSRYGNHSLKVENEIHRNRFTGIKIKHFFNGTNWKVHPKWVYCRYHYLEDHEFKTSEEEILHFLGRMYDPDFQWKKQYEAPKGEIEEIDQVVCGSSRETLNKNDYYCDQQLVQRLVFDAKNTIEAFEKWEFRKGDQGDKEKLFFQRYNVSLRFVATMSGLTRWEYIFENENTTRSKSFKSFGDIHSRAIDETWYKSAVLQHQYSIDSFVFSVPFENTKDDTLVTASYAIFLQEAGLEAPGSVVGYQFSQYKLRDKMFDTATKISTTCPECGTCNTTLDCYIVDSSGYIIVSGKNNDTGRFFGDAEGDIMQMMIDVDIFKKMVLYDYQSLCKRSNESLMGEASLLLNPFNLVVNVLNMVYWQLFNSLWQFSMYPVWEGLVLAQEETDNSTLDDADSSDDDDDSEDEITNDSKQYYACDKKTFLYILQQQYFKDRSYIWRQDKSTDGKRNYYVQPVSHSNLIFVAINNTGSSGNKVKLTATPEVIEYEEEFPCQKIDLNYLERDKPEDCFFWHPDEDKIKLCGTGTDLQVSGVFFVLALLCVLF